MILTCGSCGSLYDFSIAGSAQATARPSICMKCHQLDELLSTADALGVWRRTVDVVSGSEAATKLDRLLERMKTAADGLRSVR